MSQVLFYYDPISEFDRLFEDAITTRASLRPCASSCATRRVGQDVYLHRPRSDIHESEDANSVTATYELPGLTSDNVVIDVHQNRLTVSGEWPTQTKESSDSQGEGGYVVRERRSGKFSRTLQLPFGTKPEDVVAKMENGVLNVTFPKTSPEQQPKHVVIQTPVGGSA